MDSNYPLEIIGIHSSDVSPIDWKNETNAKAVAWNITQSNKCPELTGVLGFQGGCKWTILNSEMTYSTV